MMRCQGILTCSLKYHFNWEGMKTRFQLKINKIKYKLPYHNNASKGKNIQANILA